MIAILFIYLLSMLMMVILMPPGRAYAHSWYPIQCCWDKDCAPAKVQRVFAMSLIITKHGQAFVDDKTQVHEVPKEHDDGTVHACIVPCPTEAARDKMCVRCIFLPASM
jgi:hypothetical protein